MSKVQSFADGDLYRFALDGLRRHRNVEWVAQKLIDKHSIPRSARVNTTKQARQIRYCLDQALEYLRAAEAVSLATRPVLLYYSALSLATAEILYKQTGDSSLDRARAEHRHHGLLFRVTGKTDGPLAESASSLSAIPMLDGNKRRGTFELWHRSARHLPIVGKRITIYTTTQALSYTSNLTNSDIRLPLLPGSGITLLEVLQAYPGMRQHLPWLDVGPRLCRGEITITIYQSQPDIVDMGWIIHPSDQDVFEELLNTVRIVPEEVNKIEAEANGNALSLSVRPERSCAV